ncbi:MAG: hypothetical protein HN443_04790 [Flavobacteriaceae bacterium]|nr:hypothetical protein [Flavobacteriaceae bacterium]
MLGCDRAKEKTYNFGQDLVLLNKYTEPIVLKSNGDQCQLIVVPEYQGRVMTSTSNGSRGSSYGWINDKLIRSGEIQPHINAYGGEDRFWVGPEGGQFSVFFEQGNPFDLDHWYTPAAIDTEPFQLDSLSDTYARLSKTMHLVNYSGYKFRAKVDREVTIFDGSEIEKNLDISIEGALFVGYQSENILTNLDQTPWKKDTGLLSIWILGMFKPSDDTWVIIPYKNQLQLNTSYFGAVPPEKLKITDQVVLFKGDGKSRSKIGLPPKNALSLLGSYDAANKILTIVQFSLSNDQDYVNSLWEIQKAPYKGDVINSYNDGPTENGNQMGPFYELESSSPAKELDPGQSIKHLHSTYHFEGDFKILNALSKQLLGFDLSTMED